MAEVKQCVLTILFGTILLISIIVITFISTSFLGWFEIGVPTAEGSSLQRGLTKGELLAMITVAVTMAAMAVVMLRKTFNW